MVVASAVGMVTRDAARVVRRRAIDRGQPGATGPADPMLTSARTPEPTRYARSAQNRQRVEP